MLSPNPPESSLYILEHPTILPNVSSIENIVSPNSSTGAIEMYPVEYKEPILPNMVK